MRQVGEGVSVVNVENHQYALSILVELLPDGFIIIIATEIEEVYTDRRPLDLHLFDTIVDADGRYVSFHESALTIPLD